MATALKLFGAPESLLGVGIVPTQGYQDNDNFGQEDPWEGPTIFDGDDETEVQAEDEGVDTHTDSVMVFDLAQPTPTPVEVQLESPEPFEELESMTMPQIKAICKLVKVSPVGSKAKLIARIKAAPPPAEIPLEHSHWWKG